jgi:YHS domain-containing protein
VGPLRILILAALLYIGYRLISANFKKDSGEKKEDKEEGSAQSAQPSGESGSITDVLVEDPVCRKLVPKQQAHTVELEGEIHYFCSKECGDAFAAEHEKND